MQNFIKTFFLLTIFSSPLILSSFDQHSSIPKTGFSFPYKQAGLTREQAAAHLLSRFSFGARPGEVETVVNTGLEQWFSQQLQGGLPDDSLQQYLEHYETLRMSNQQIVQTFPKGAQVLRMAVKEGLINKDSIATAGKKEYRGQLAAFMEQKGLKPQAELFRQLINQKILRAAYSSNQLHELLTDFWFNHFNVSLTKNDCAQFVLAYERDAIRPNVTAKFETLLLATARSPAMLTYLDNFSSSAPKQEPAPQQQRIRSQLLAGMAEAGSDSMQAVTKIRNANKSQGINENYAREIMELHTLGVDGGYTQSDVTQAARVLTGWTIYPMSDYGAGQVMRKVVDHMGSDRMARQGFVHDGDFLFAANRHDRGEKTVLGTKFASDGGYEEGAELIHLLAHHPSTARFICTKLAVRFVSDNPPASLITKMVKTFTNQNGDIGQVLITMACAPEFWSPQALREKTKSPFELAISSVRGLDARMAMPYQLNNWISKMGQKIYYYQAPTGFPDKGQYWINTGSLLNRMNFGLALASQRIPGITFSLLAINHNHEPESAENALATYSRLLMPERDLAETIKRLTPLLNDPELNKKVDAAAIRSAPATPQNTGEQDETDMMMGNKKGNKNNLTTRQMQAAPGSNSMLGQVVGIIIGSPEFQRK